MCVPLSEHCWASGTGIVGLLTLLGSCAPSCGVVARQPTGLPLLAGVRAQQPRRPRLGLLGQRVCDETVV